jgi:predicted ester cyclase
MVEGTDAFARRSGDAGRGTLRAGRPSLHPSGQQVKALAGPTTAHTSIDAAMRPLPAVRSLAVASGDLRATYAAIIASAGVGDDAAFDRLLVDDFVDHNPVPGQPAGRAGFAYWAASARAAFAGLHGTVEDTLVDGDKLAGRITWRGTHAGPFLGVPATGRELQFAAFHIVRFADGLAAEWWGTGDLLTALIQLGATIGPPE